MTSKRANFTRLPLAPNPPSPIAAAMRVVRGALEYRDGMAGAWTRNDVPTPILTFCRGGMRCCVGSIIVDPATMTEACPFCQCLEPHVGNTGPERVAFCMLLVGGH